VRAASAGRIAIAALTLALVAGSPRGAPAAARGSSDAKTMSGHGGYPLNDSVTSMWGVIDEPIPRKQKALTFLIYFRGAPGWHQGTWSMKVRADDEPAVIEFSKDSTIVLHAEYRRFTKSFSLFRTEVPIGRSNVVLVDRVDHPGEEVVTELGRVNLRMPADANPALVVVERSRRIREALFGSTK
jgi:hypothetical protein